MWRTRDEIRDVDSFSLGFVLELITGKTIYNRSEGAGPAPPQVLMLIEHLTGEDFGFDLTRPLYEKAREEALRQEPWLNTIQLPDGSATRDELYWWAYRLEHEYESLHGTNKVTFRSPVTNS